jgi:hypothetical protein
MEKKYFIENPHNKDFESYVNDGYFIVQNNKKTLLRLPPEGFTILPSGYGAISEINEEVANLIEGGKISIFLQPESKQKAEESKKLNKKSAKIEDKETIAEPQLIQEPVIAQVEEEVHTPSEENKIVETERDEALNIVSEPQNSDSL